MLGAAAETEAASTRTHDAAGSTAGERRGWRSSSEEHPTEQIDRIGDRLKGTAPICVVSFEAGVRIQRARCGEESQGEDDIDQADVPIGICIPADEIESLDDDRPERGGV